MVLALSTLLKIDEGTSAHTSQVEALFTLMYRVSLPVILQESGSLRRFKPYTRWAGDTRGNMASTTSFPCVIFLLDTCVIFSVDRKTKLEQGDWPGLAVFVQPTP